MRCRWNVLVKIISESWALGFRAKYNLPRIQFCKTAASKIGVSPDREPHMWTREHTHTHIRKRYKKTTHTFFLLRTELQFANHSYYVMHVPVSWLQLLCHLPKPNWHWLNSKETKRGAAARFAWGLNYSVISKLQTWAFTMNNVPFHQFESFNPGADELHIHKPVTETESFTADVHVRRHAGVETFI